MNAQLNNKKKLLLLLIPVILITLCLLEGIKSALHNLDGERLPEKIPIMGGSPPNSFLLWGVFGFFVFGLTTVNLSLRKYDERMVRFKVLSLLSIVTSVMLLIGNLLTYREGLIWRNEASGLILVWIISYWAGVIWSYAYSRLKTLFKKSVDEM